MKGWTIRGAATGKLLLSAALVMVAATLVGLGAFATFTDTASVSRDDTTGTVTLNPIGTNGANNRLSLSSSNIAAGDTMQRAVNIKDTGSIDLNDVKLTTTATATSLLDTDPTNGLQLVIDKCSQAWTESGSAPRYTYTCGGTTSSVLASTPVIGANMALNNLTLTAGSDNFLRVTLTLPGAAGNTFQNKSSTIQFAFTGTQRNATNQ
jgi:hypothetical protein